MKQNKTIQDTPIQLEKITPLDGGQAPIIDDPAMHDKVLGAGTSAQRQISKESILTETLNAKLK